MSSTTAYGQCLACQQSRPLEGVAVARHLAPEEQPGAEPFGGEWVCIGSGHRPAWDDGDDATRRYAVQRAALATRAASKLRSETASAIADKNTWPVAEVIKHYGGVVVLNETLARYWRDLANAKDPLHVVKDALANLRTRNSSASLIDQAMADALSAAARQFLAELRHEMMRCYPDGLTAEQVFTLFFSI